MKRSAMLCRFDNHVRMLLVLLALSVVPGVPALGEQRLALVIGNAAYRGNDALDNPINDAQDMAAALRQVDFEVMEVYDADRREMKTAIRSFGRKLRREDVGLFYFSGHGVQYAGENYLIPIGAVGAITAVGHFDYEAVPAGYVTSVMEDANNDLNVVILDACRDNPFKGLFRGSGPEGLQPMEVPSGSILAYSTRPGTKALDGRGRNSPYVKHLKRALLQPGLTIEAMLRSVRVAVMQETGGKQAPGYYSELNRAFCFIGPCGSVGQVPQVQAPLAAPEETSVFQDRLRDGSPGPEMVRIPAGEFLMGSPENEEGRYGNEKQRRVRIERDFTIGRYEVTVGQFQQFVEVTGYRTEAETGDGCYVWDGSAWKKDSNKTWRNPGFQQDAGHPVVCVSWNDVLAYTEWFSRQTGQSYRLPTEAEWEYAARVGTQTARYWGDNPDDGCAYANGADQTLKAELGWSPVMNCQDGYVYTAPVGRFRANGWGLYDMLGNVWEWTCSGYDENYGGAESECISKNRADPRVLRGGSWDNYPHRVRAANRYGDTPAFRTSGLGFRLARNL